MQARQMTVSEAPQREVELPYKTTHKPSGIITAIPWFTMSAVEWFVYIAQAPTGRYYTGITTDPKRRNQEHNRDEGAKFAHDQDALRLLYTSPPFPDQSAARFREVQIKGWTR
ncbi:GIY-YIG nuclease family protein [Candidatus Peregrinibacteria bacterium]|nr:GIY-YIG nuclease family protein [Candidatus Peregrinibacteria bacterium]